MKRLTIVAAAVAMMLAIGARANAAGITVDDPGIVGSVDGLSGDNPGDIAQMVALAQGILDLTLGQSVSTVDTRDWQANHVYDYSGTIQTPATSQHFESGHPFQAPSGYTYALAKYDGQNAGWVLFYLPTFGTTLPEYSYSIWGKDASQYQISSFWVFNPVTAPDGGSTAALLGSALVGFGILRRRFSSR